jgi:sugar/nucleoside kinase (ribokinase family)
VPVTGSTDHRRWDVVGIGENSVDVVYRLPGPPPARGKMPISAWRTMPGGQVATTLSCCASLGLKTLYVGTFGDDDNGRFIRSTLEELGIDTSHAPVRPVPNRHAVILLDERSGERGVLWHRDPALALDSRDLPADVIRRARVVHVDAIDEDAAIAAARLARAAGAAVTTDIDQVTIRTRELISAATFPILAEHVPEALTGESDPARALRSLRQSHGDRLCVTLGRHGALLLDGDDLYRSPAFEIAPVDTTGAGDVFRGALIYSLLRGDEPGAMLRFANAAAAISCTREGAIGGIPTLAEVERLFTTGATVNSPGATETPRHRAR